MAFTQLRYAQHMQKIGNVRVGLTVDLTDAGAVHCMYSSRGLAPSRVDEPQTAVVVTFMLAE